MTASAWSPNPNTVTQANASGLLKMEVQIATLAQQVFTLASFAYAINTGSLLVFKAGKILARNVDYVETGITTFTLATPSTAGDVITILGFVGTTATVATDTILRSDLAGLAGASLLGYSQLGTGTVARTVQDELRDHISVKQFGAKGDGITDDTSAILAARTAAAGKALYIPAGTYLISQEISLDNSTTVYGDGDGSLIKLLDSNKSGFTATGKYNVVVRDLAILCDHAGTIAYIAGVLLTNCSKSKVLNVTCLGLSWGGVLLWSSSQCLIRGCRFAGWLGAIPDSHDIGIYRNSYYNVVEGNQCFGGGWHGIMINDPYVASTPTANIINANQVGEHLAYGILLYTALATTPAYNLRTIISNNVVSDILGSVISGGCSGAGIYIQAGGGTIVSGNSVFNCCRSTVNFETLGMAGIVLQVATSEFWTGSEVEIMCTGNSVTAARGPCLWATGSNRSININSNNFKSTGTAAGNRGEAVVLYNIQGVKFTNNSIRHENPNYFAIKFQAIIGDYSCPDISDNIITCVNSAGGLLVTTSDGGTINDAKVSGNSISGALANPAYQIQNVGRLRFYGNMGTSGGVVFDMYNCPRARMSNNVLNSSYANASITFRGANPYASADESNDFNGIVENNTGNGMKITLVGTAAPAITGLWDVGDTVLNRGPTAGGVDKWRCVTAGNAGSWKVVSLGV